MLSNPFFLAVKAGLAALLALVLDALLGNPDHVSATFIAVLCVSPTVLIGLRRASSQFIGSVVGGVLGTSLMALGLPVWVGVPVAVALSIRAAFFFGVPMGHNVAAFSALIVQLVPRGGPVETLEVRMLAVLIAAVSGFLVNLVVSGMAYEEIFGRRVRAAEDRVLELLPSAARTGPEAAQPGFTALAQLQDELGRALEELRWRRNWQKHAALQRAWWRVARLRHLLHLGCELAYARREGGLSRATLEPFLDWLERLDGEPPPVPEALEPAAARIVNALRGRDSPLDT